MDLRTHKNYMTWKNNIMINTPFITTLLRGQMRSGGRQQAPRVQFYWVMSPVMSPVMSDKKSSFDLSMPVWDAWRLDLKIRGKSN